MCEELKGEGGDIAGYHFMRLCEEREWVGVGEGWRVGEKGSREGGRKGGKRGRKKRIS